MKELSLNILDIAMNSVKAEATRIDIEIRETEDELEFSVTDNGFGMSEEMIRNVKRPVLHHAEDAQGRTGHPLPASGRRADGRQHLDHVARAGEIPERLRDADERQILQKAHRLHPAGGYYIDGVYADSGFARHRLYLYAHGTGHFGLSVYGRNARNARPGRSAVLGGGHRVDGRLPARSVRVRRIKCKIKNHNTYRKGQWE